VGLVIRTSAMGVSKIVALSDNDPWIRGRKSKPCRPVIHLMHENTEMAQRRGSKDRITGTSLTPQKSHVLHGLPCPKVDAHLTRTYPVAEQRSGYTPIEPA
jgi:hypothetical protein